MLSWKKDDENREEFNQARSFCEDLFKSTTFRKGDSVSRASFPDVSELPDIVRETIKESLQYYDKLYQLRI